MRASREERIFAAVVEEKKLERRVRWDLLLTDRDLVSLDNTLLIRHYSPRGLLCPHLWRSRNGGCSSEAFEEFATRRGRFGGCGRGGCGRRGLAAGAREREVVAQAVDVRHDGRREQLLRTGPGQVNASAPSSPRPLSRLSDVPPARGTRAARTAPRALPRRAAAAAAWRQPRAAAARARACPRSPTLRASSRRQRSGASPPPPRTRRRRRRRCRRRRLGG